MLLDELFEAFEGEVAAPLAVAVAARLQVAGRCWAVQFLLLMGRRCKRQHAEIAASQQTTQLPCTRHNTRWLQALPMIPIYLHSRRRRQRVQQAGRTGGSCVKRCCMEWALSATICSAWRQAVGGACRWMCRV